MITGTLRYSPANADSVFLCSPHYCFDLSKATLPLQQICESLFSIAGIRGQEPGNMQPRPQPPVTVAKPKAQTLLKGPKTLHHACAFHSLEAGGEGQPHTGKGFHRMRTATEEALWLDECSVISIQGFVDDLYGDVRQTENSRAREDNCVCRIFSMCRDHFTNNKAEA